MIRFSVTKNGMPLSKKLYTWDEKTKTFSSKEDGLILDFTGINRVTFNTDSDCTFKTGFDCTFNTGSSCAFNTSFGCTFNTGYSCTFNTSFECTFKTGSDCTFNTGNYCTFNTSSYCTFITGPYCIFEVGENCFVRRPDVKGVKGVTEIPTGKKIKLNGYEIAGYTVIEEKKEIPTCNGKVVEIDGKKYKLTEIKE
jgi:hypothetical protein